MEMLDLLIGLIVWLIILWVIWAIFRGMMEGLDRLINDLTGRLR
ncbi:hypothetical protein [Thermococcus radiotolerans]|nr:hypothetical protein [Thermococcus radiotolerans]